MEAVSLKPNITSLRTIFGFFPFLYEVPGIQGVQLIHVYEVVWVGSG